MKQYFIALLFALIFIASIIIIILPNNPTSTPATVSPTLTSTQNHEVEIISLIANLPEVKKENELLLTSGTKTTLYIESKPTDSDPNYYIYYGESYPDHNVRLVSFIVNSQTKKISVDNIISPEPIGYDVWKTTCHLLGCPSSTPTTLDKTITVKIYQNPSDNSCISSDFQTVELPKSATPLKDSIQYLIGTLDNSRGFNLVTATINTGVATLTFEDPNYFSSGGSCWAESLASRIEKTALQFNSVKSVKFKGPEHLFQP